MMLDGFLTIMIIYFVMEKQKIMSKYIYCQEEKNNYLLIKIQIIIQKVHGNRHLYMQKVVLIQKVLLLKMDLPGDLQKVHIEDIMMNQCTKWILIMKYGLELMVIKPHQEKVFYPKLSLVLLQ